MLSRKFLTAIFAVVCILGASSAWAAQKTDVTSLWPVDWAKPGAEIALWAQVANTSQSQLPNDAQVWFYTDSPAWAAQDTQWLGSAEVSYLQPGRSQWFSLQVQVPQETATGWQKYSAQVWAGDSQSGFTQLSSMSQFQSFLIPEPGKPAQAMPLSPDTLISSQTPEISWSQVDNASWYRLWIGDLESPVFQQWYRAVDVCSGQTCTVQPETALPEGEHTWWVRTWNPNDYGLWSQGQGFSLQPDSGGVYTYLTDSLSFDAGGDFTLAPAGQEGAYEHVYVTINHPFTYSGNGTLQLALDFDAQESVHQAGESGQWILRPTVQASHETQNGTLGISSQYLQFRTYAPYLDQYRGYIELSRSQGEK